MNQKYNAIISVACFLSLEACKPMSIGGGSELHAPPKSIVAGKMVELDLRLSAWGEESRASSERWKHVRCTYRYNENETFRQLNLKKISEKDGEIRFQCVLPPAPESGVLEYQFFYTFDGRRNESDIYKIPVEKQKTS